LKSFKTTSCPARGIRTTSSSRAETGARARRPAAGARVFLPAKAALLLLPVWFCQCGQQEPPGERSLFLRITSVRDEGAPDFLAVLTDDEGETQRVSCLSHSSDDANLACAPSGLRLAEAPPSFHLTIKARGYGFVTRSVDVSDLDRNQEGEAELEIQLQKLEAFEQNDDYATGYGPEDGLELFEQMAHNSDTEIGPAQAIKFYIRNLPDSPQVFFQNTRRHPVHYDFARSVLGEAVSLSEYEAATYSGEQRTAMAGTVVRYPAVRAQSGFLEQEARAPLAVTFFPSDDLAPEQALLAHRLLEERLGFAGLQGGQDRVVYLPAGEVQQSELEAESELFRRADAAWMVRQELFGDVSLQILNPGLAYGNLKVLSPEQLQATPVSFTDILLLTRLPNSLPVVGGTITEQMQTPLAHVNVAARARGTPNIALPGASGDERVAPLIGKLVRFEVGQGTFSLTETSLQQAQQFWNGRNPEPTAPLFDLGPQELSGFEQLGFADSVSVGAKAANLAELRRLLGERAPHGFAVPFYYYDRFMQTVRVTAALCDQARSDCLFEGRAEDTCDKAHALCLPPGAGPEMLWDHAARILQQDDFQQDTALREAALDALQYHIRHIEVDPDFAAALDARVAEVFGSITVRLRSSTNTEDLPDFSGAGLYDSLSATASGERAASLRVREVWASAWNFRAFEERAFWNIDHLAVRMGVAVNQAFQQEAANGVLITQNIADPLVAGMYVNVQRGEIPVTNPANGALPEIFSIIPSPSYGIQVVRLGYSSLSPDRPILSSDEIADLYDAAARVQDHFAGLYDQDPRLLALDLEFKFHGPERALFIKQARPYLR
jgi:pyruvate,water dikinase